VIRELSGMHVHDPIFTLSPNPHLSYICILSIWRDNVCSSGGGGMQATALKILAVMITLDDFDGVETSHLRALVRHKSTLDRAI